MDYTQRFVDLLWSAKNFGLKDEEWEELKRLCHKTIQKSNFHMKDKK